MREFIKIITIIVNVISMFAMIVGVLLHSGRGGGLCDMNAVPIVTVADAIPPHAVV